MKKLLVLVAAAFLVSGTVPALAQDSTRIKVKKASKHAGKTCTVPTKTKKL